MKTKGFEEVLEHRLRKVDMPSVFPKWTDKTRKELLAAHQKDKQEAIVAANFLVNSLISC